MCVQAGGGVEAALVCRHMGVCTLKKDGLETKLASTLAMSVERKTSRKILLLFLFLWLLEKEPRAAYMLEVIINCHVS